MKEHGVADRKCSCSFKNIGLPLVFHCIFVSITRRLVGGRRVTKEKQDKRRLLRFVGLIFTNSDRAIQKR